MIDAENAFNSINRKVMLNNLKFIFPNIGSYIINCYETPSRLFLVGGGEILYAFGILPLIKFLLEFIYAKKVNAKEVALQTTFLLLAVRVALKITGTN